MLINLFIKAINNILSSIIIFFIKIYQKVLSPDHSWLRWRYPYGYCRFQPTCSNYAIQAISKYGIIKGSLKAIWRLLRCNPWNKGGHDPV